MVHVVAQRLRDTILLEVDGVHPFKTSWVAPLELIAAVEPLGGLIDAWDGNLNLN